jgi:hypothetical protein
VSSEFLVSAPPLVLIGLEPEPELGLELCPQLRSGVLEGGRKSNWLRPEYCTRGKGKGSGERSVHVLRTVDHCEWRRGRKEGRGEVLT